MYCCCLLLLTVVLNSIVISLTASTNGLCNESITSAILNMTTAPTNFLKKLMEGSPYTYVSTTNNDSIQSFQNQRGCVILTLSPSGSSSSSDRGVVTDTFYYNKVNKSSNTLMYPFTNTMIQTYQEKVIERGFLLETDSESTTYQLLILDISPVFCYYRCANSIEGENVPFATAAVSMKRNIKSRKIQSAIQRCKDRLLEAGVGELVDLRPCKSHCNK